MVGPLPFSQFSWAAPRRRLALPRATSGSPVAIDPPRSYPIRHPPRGPLPRPSASPSPRPGCSTSALSAPPSGLPRGRRWWSSPHPPTRLPRPRAPAVASPSL
ncbi:putative basic proline-rich protein-like [Iris pallida]|nr:putative basic proline-rich protein-like [Iris pallida]